MLIFFLTTDLVFPSRLAGIAAKLGAPMETAGNESSLLDKVKQAQSADAVVLLDLSIPAVDAAQTVAALKALSPPPQAIIAFGPHVHEAKLAAAEAACCDMVLSRGQFDARIAPILEQYVARKSTE